MPNISIKNGDQFTFYTRVPTGGAAFPDRLQVRMSLNGASTNAGATATSVGDFTNLLLDINPTYGAAYPETWQQFPQGSKVREYTILDRNQFGDSEPTVKRCELLLERVNNYLQDQK